MKSGLVLEKKEDNGSVYNAKGDLVANGPVLVSAVEFNGLATASVVFNADGTISRNSSSNFPADYSWVDTDGTNDVPVDNSAWIGASNYTIEWTHNTGITVVPSANSAGPQSFPQTFSASVVSGMMTGIWTVTITNISTSATVSYDVEVDVEVTI